MNKILNNVIVLTIGAAIGAVVTWRFTKTKYKKIANEEIESVKETFRKKEKRLIELNDQKPGLDVYKKILGELSYANDELMAKKAAEKNIEPEELETTEDSEEPVPEKTYHIDEEPVPEKTYHIDEEGWIVENREYKKPYVITPEEFDNSNEDYGTDSYNYYADGVLTDLYGTVIDNDMIDDIIGEESLKHFGEYEIDTVYVRNDEMAMEYEVVRDARKYSDVYGDDDE